MVKANLPLARRSIRSLRRSAAFSRGKGWADTLKSPGGSGLYGRADQIASTGDSTGCSWVYLVGSGHRLTFGILRDASLQRAGPRTPGFPMEAVSHRFRACCHGLYAAPEALKGVNPLDVTAVKTVGIQTHSRRMSVCNKPAAVTGPEARVSCRMVTALSLPGCKSGDPDRFPSTLCGDPYVQCRTCTPKSWLWSWSMKP